MNAPSWWEKQGTLSTMLLPLAALYSAAGDRQRQRANPVQAKVPVVCVGNLVAGGAGKTPVALALGTLAKEIGLQPHFLSRGYGGHLAGPVLVDPGKYDFRAVGDEALLLARVAPTWVSRDRSAGAAAAAAGGAGLIIMDDGLQNLSLVQDRALLVVDGTYGFGNGRVIPAGPLRETLRSAQPRLHAGIIIGEDRHGLADSLAPLPVIHARLEAVEPYRFTGRRFLPFAGIGRPAKFFQTLHDLGAKICDPAGFADHHPFTSVEIGRLRDGAQKLSAGLITTEKDWVRIPADDRAGIEVLPVQLAWDDPAGIIMEHILKSLPARGR